MNKCRDQGRTAVRPFFLPQREVEFSYKCGKISTVPNALITEEVYMFAISEIPYARIKMARGIRLSPDTTLLLTATSKWEKNGAAEVYLRLLTGRNTDDLMFGTMPIKDLPNPLLKDKGHRKRDLLIEFIQNGYMPNEAWLRVALTEATAKWKIAVRRGEAENGEPPIVIETEGTPKPCMVILGPETYLKYFLVN